MLWMLFIYLAGVILCTVLLALDFLPPVPDEFWHATVFSVLGAFLLAFFWPLYLVIFAPEGLRRLRAFLGWHEDDQEAAE